MLSALLLLMAQAAPACGSLAAGWEPARINRSEPVNTVVIEGGGIHKPTWNGVPITMAKVQEYLGVTRQMSPQPVFVLIVSPNANCEEVSAYRRMVSQTVKCGAGRCIEVDP